MHQPDPASESIAEQAAAWQIRLASGRVSEADAKRFADWLAANPEHEAAYRQMQALWQQLPAPILADRQRRRAQAAKAVRRVWLLSVGKFAVAASVLLLLSLRFFPDYLDYPLSDYRTRIGEQLSISLADGSTVYLNTDTVINVAISDRERRVSLQRGEAEFEVAHDAGRPFRVASGDVTTEALGTRFIVRHHGGAGSVTLLQGKVRSSRPSPHGAETDSVALLPGQRLQFGAQSLGPAETVDTSNVDAWRSGRLIANFISLGDALAEINRYRRVPIQLLDAGLADRQVNIAVDLAHVEDWLTALQQLMPLAVVKVGPFVFLRS